MDNRLIFLYQLWELACTLWERPASGWKGGGKRLMTVKPGLRARSGTDLEPRKGMRDDESN
jgi:hypothetical protein